MLHQKRLSITPLTYKVADGCVEIANCYIKLEKISAFYWILILVPFDIAGSNQNKDFAIT